MLGTHHAGAARRRRGLSQAVLSGLVDRSESWLSQVEREQRAVDNHTVINALADILGLPVDELTVKKTNAASAIQRSTTHHTRWSGRPCSSYGWTHPPTPRSCGQLCSSIRSVLRRSSLIIPLHDGATLGFRRCTPGLGCLDAAHPRSGYQRGR
ncbi:helix-turn-helix domain-containing protein [Nonomuraea sp. NPDC049400]|uniref:helix-turn-helix domain-containing protein n=1 Tax=Nonomuraea sp. NPDC049400 TaxID=3364352 RepID=UPI0037A78936